MELSKVLDDVYETKQGAAPEWADEQRLDEAFAEWTPGPPADAPAAEREMAMHHVGRTRLDNGMAAASTRAPVVELTDLAVRPKPFAPARWVRGDDDVAFGGARAPRSSRSRFGRG
jgi:hypothetical protein